MIAEFLLLVDCGVHYDSAVDVGEHVSVSRHDIIFLQTLSFSSGGKKKKNGMIYAGLRGLIIDGFGQGGELRSHEWWHGRGDLGLCGRHRGRLVHDRFDRQNGFHVRVSLFSDFA